MGRCCADLKVAATCVVFPSSHKQSRGHTALSVDGEGRAAAGEWSTPRLVELRACRLRRVGEDKLRLAVLPLRQRERCNRQAVFTVLQLADDRVELHRKDGLADLR